MLEVLFTALVSGFVIFAIATLLYQFLGVTIIPELVLFFVAGLLAANYGFPFWPWVIASPFGYFLVMVLLIGLDEEVHQEVLLLLLYGACVAIGFLMVRA